MTSKASLKKGAVSDLTWGDLMSLRAGPRHVLIFNCCCQVRVIDPGVLSHVSSVLQKRACARSGRMLSTDIPWRITTSMIMTSKHGLT